MRIAALAVLFLRISGMAAEHPTPQAAPTGLQTEYLIQQIQRLNGLKGMGLSIRACALEQDQEAHSAALRLATIGLPALAGVREALKTGVTRHSSAWLLYTYAKIQGPGAFDELVSTASSLLSGEGSRCLAAAAVSRSLTSVVGGRHEVAFSRRGRVVVCSALEPRHTLDLFLLALLRGDRSLLARSLGSSGVAQLAALQDAEIFPTFSQSQQDCYVSYKMEDWDAWSELVPEHSHETLRADQPGATTNLNIEFFTGHGARCLRRSLSFRSVPTESGGLSLHAGTVEYRIEPDSLVDLSRAIRGCIWTPTQP